MGAISELIRTEKDGTISLVIILWIKRQSWTTLSMTVIYTK